MCVMPTRFLWRFQEPSRRSFITLRQKQGPANRMIFLSAIPMLTFWERRTLWKSSERLAQMCDALSWLGLALCMARVPVWIRQGN